MDQLLINTFYTYSFVDPEMNTYIHGELEITRPDIMERKLRVVKDLTVYIHKNRRLSEVHKKD